MRTFKRSGRHRVRITAAITALALLLAACGSGETGGTTLEQAAADQAQASDSDSDGAEAADGDSADGGAGESDPATEEPEAEQAGPEIPSNHLFPDLETVRVTDGQTINLADELAGGDTPILLWFYAPH